ncbi:type I methionyl aminopeptidase [Thermosulfuriphilus sp.]
MKGTARGIILKAPWEIEKLRVANSIVAEILAKLREVIAPGISTWDLDRLADEWVREKGALPAFKGYRGFPFSLCVSINEEVVHGIPSRERILREGDIVSLDFGAIYDGYVGDAAVTIPVGRISEEAARLIKVTRECLDLAIDRARFGNRVQDISAAIQRHAEAHGFSVVRQFVGHGVGRSLHEGPEVPNFGRPGKGPRLQPGMVIAIEPMVNVGGSEVEILADGWTAVTKDRSLSAHFEHSVAITAKGPQILSRLEE